MTHLHPPPPELAPCVPSSTAAPRERVREVAMLLAGCEDVGAVREVAGSVAEPPAGPAAVGVVNGAIGGGTLLLALVALLVTGTFVEDPRPRIDGRSENPKSDFFTLSVNGDMNQ